MGLFDWSSALPLCVHEIYSSFCVNERRQDNIGPVAAFKMPSGHKIDVNWNGSRYVVTLFTYDFNDPIRRESLSTPNQVIETVQTMAQSLESTT